LWGILQRENRGKSRPTDKTSVHKPNILKIIAPNLRRHLHHHRGERFGKFRSWYLGANPQAVVTAVKEDGKMCPARELLPYLAGQ
jgi:hypothetical protein